MGCVSSKMFMKQFKQENLYINHVVSLTSTTYGVLELDKEKGNQKQSIDDCAAGELNKPPPSGEDFTIINTWELMEGLEEQISLGVQFKKSSPKAKLFLRGFGDINVENPFKFLNQMGSPKKGRKSFGKENKGKMNGGNRSLENSPKGVLKECNTNLKKPSPKLWASIKRGPEYESLRIDTGVISSRRRSLSPFFDPILVENEKLCEEQEEEIKKMVLISSIFEMYERKCPPGGENGVVIYTTTLRGIRKTFEDCNFVRSILVSQDVEMFERDISMHSGFKEELRSLMSSKEMRVPLVFVKGRLIGGVEEMVKLDEEGKLGILFDGIPKAAVASCGGCGGIRFIMCMECNGSSKVLGVDGRKSVKCSECNENGLIQCPICC
ncbi:hypothetical protein ACJIZ3_023874 [Penstemon smallii]|uniref:Glutaredoxin domain-containing protein n=1 Tax=Penstemon smallii TaxID=265156 RepID=A0ABD3TTB6_9LAMI